MRAITMTVLALGLCAAGAAAAETQTDAMQADSRAADADPDLAYRRIINAMSGMSVEEKARFLQQNPRLLQFLQRKHPHIVARLRNALDDDDNGRERQLRRLREDERTNRRLERRELRRHQAPVNRRTVNRR